MESENYVSVFARPITSIENVRSVDENLRRRCGCLRTSEKLKQILDSFPAPPPPSPGLMSPSKKNESNCISAYCKHSYPTYHSTVVASRVNETTQDQYTIGTEESKGKINLSKSWRVVTEAVQLVQLSVTATALALYYVIYCYMQLVYYTLRSALYFHNADGPMKITIGVVTITSLVVGFNLILRLERLMGVLC